MSDDPTDTGKPIPPARPPRAQTFHDLRLEPGSVTGRFRTVGEHFGWDVEKVQHAPLWYHLLERFGFPTVVALGLAFGIAVYNRQVREDRRTDHQEHLAAMREQHEAFVGALRNNTDAIKDSAQELQKIRRDLGSRDRESRMPEEPVKRIQTGKGGR